MRVQERAWRRSRGNTSASWDQDVKLLIDPNIMNVDEMMAGRQNLFMCNAFIKSAYSHSQTLRLRTVFQELAIKLFGSASPKCSEMSFWRGHWMYQIFLTRNSKCYYTAFVLIRCIVIAMISHAHFSPCSQVANLFELIKGRSCMNTRLL